MPANAAADGRGRDRRLPGRRLPRVRGAGAVHADRGVGQPAVLGRMEGRQGADLGLGRGLQHRAPRLRQAASRAVKRFSRSRRRRRRRAAGAATRAAGRAGARCSAAASGVPRSATSDADVVGHRPEVGLGQDVLPGRHRGAADAGGDGAVDVRQRLAAAQLVEGEVGRQDLDAVVAVLGDRRSRDRRATRAAPSGQLLGEVVDLGAWSRRPGGRRPRTGRARGRRACRASIAVGLAVRPRDRAARRSARPGCSVRQRGAKAFTYWMRSSSSAAGTSQASIAVPCRPPRERAHEVGVARQLAGRHRARTCRRRGADRAAAGAGPAAAGPLPSPASPWQGRQKCV